MDYKKKFSKKALNDFKLIDLAINKNDQNAYSEIMKSYKNSIYFTILKMIKNKDDAEEKNKMAYEYYKRFDNMFTGPGKVFNGEVEPLPRNQNYEEMKKNLLICPVNEMIDKLGVYAEAGIDEIIISSSFGQNQKDIIESMHRMSEEVIPYFKKTNFQVA